jgi:hypothetical protein
LVGVLRDQFAGNTGLGLDRAQRLAAAHVLLLEEAACEQRGGPFPLPAAAVAEFLASTAGGRGICCKA